MDYNQTSSPQVSTPQTMSVGKGKKKVIVGLVVLMVVLIVALILVLAYKSFNRINPPSLTEAERQSILDSLEKTASAAPKITDEERRSILDSLEKTSATAPALTPAERQTIIDSFPK